jgi:hypothetical protein
MVELYELQFLGTLASHGIWAKRKWIVRFRLAYDGRVSRDFFPMLVLEILQLIIRVQFHP